MDSAMVTATWQAAALSALSNILGQTIKCYQSNRPLSLNTTDLAHFVLFAILSTPPNFAWQSWLEATFPGYTQTETQPKKSDEKNPTPTKSLNITNTAIKFALDQTIGATVNTVLYIAALDLMRGRSSEAIITHCKEAYWPLMMAGLKMWPAVSILNFTMVPVDYRIVVGSIAGLFWGIYLSLIQ